MSPVRITRTREYLADGNGDLIFIINQTGKATTSARDPVFANCRSENVACVEGASSPFDSVACSSLLRACATQRALAREQLRRRIKGKNTSMQNAAHPFGGDDLRRR